MSKAAAAQMKMVSTRVAVTALTLVTLCVLATHTSADHPGCCRNYIKGKLRYENIKGYSVQTATEMCPIDAIIFHLKRAKACTDPALEWVMAYVNRIRYKAQKVHQTAQTQELSQKKH